MTLILICDMILMMMMMLMIHYYFWPQGGHLAQFNLLQNRLPRPADKKRFPKMYLPNSRKHDLQVI